MPSLRQSSAMLTSPRRPSSTMRIFSCEPFCQFADVLFALLGQWDVGSTSVLAKERPHLAC